MDECQHPCTDLTPGPHGPTCHICHVVLPWPEGVTPPDPPPARPLFPEVADAAGLVGWLEEALYYTEPGTPYAEVAPAMDFNPRSARIPAGARTLVSQAHKILADIGIDLGVQEPVVSMDRPGCHAHLRRLLVALRLRQATPSTHTPRAIPVASDGATLEERAMAAILAHRHEGWTATDLARHLGIGRATLYRRADKNHVLRAAMAELRRPVSPKKGHVSADGDVDGVDEMAL
jgi:hypothetical protein